MLPLSRNGARFYPLDYFIAMASLSTSLFLIWAVLGLGTDAAAAVVLGRHDGVREDGNGGSAELSNGLQDVLGKAHEGMYDYPTSFTQGIIAKPVHSHNDYWRPVPFYTALSVGCISIEADVWLYNDTLYVGHERAALTKERTFESLYINPILDVLKRQNPKSAFVDENAEKMGVFDTDGGQTLYLWVDVKTEGNNTWEAVVRALEPLRKEGYLTSINNTIITHRPITIIGTGSTPLSLIAPVHERDYFSDYSIPLLTSSPPTTPLISPIASTDFIANFGPVLGTSLNGTQLELLREQVKTAHEMGIKLRYWNQPQWPVSTRNGIWRQLRSEGVDFINVDVVAAGAGFEVEW